MAYNLPYQMVNRQLAPGIDFFFLITSWGKGGELSPGFPPWETEKCHWAIRLLAAVGIEVDLLSTVLSLQLMWDAYFLAKEEKDGYYLQIANPSAVSRFPSNGSLYLAYTSSSGERKNLSAMANFCFSLLSYVDAYKLS